MSFLNKASNTHNICNYAVQIKNLLFYKVLQKYALFLKYYISSMIAEQPKKSWHIAHILYVSLYLIFPYF